MSGIFKTIRSFPKVFWVSNTMELFERWAWYGFYMAFALYLVGSKDTGALGFSSAEKGAIMGTGSMLLYLLPLFTGAIADRVGYKKILILSYAMYVSGYWMVATFNSFTLVFAAYIYLAVAGALFKPIISAMISKTTTSETSSIGFGIFYMMINIGGFIGPFIAGAIYQKSWDWVFYISMITISINYIFVFFFFKEPGREENGDKEPLGQVFLQALRNIGITLSNFKYVLFLLIMVAFWTAFNQLYYAFPVFVDDWVDTSNLYNALHAVWPWLAESIGTKEGTITAVTIGSFDAFFIIIFQIWISGIVMRYKPLNAMMSGIFVLAIGVGMMFAFQNSFFIILGVLIFSIGEMASSPKFTEYVGSIAPADKKALYMGTSFLPIAVGHQLAGVVSGDIYDKAAGKLHLLSQEVAKRGLDIPEVSETFTKNDYWNKAAELMGMSNSELTNFIWVNYNPSKIWMLYAGIAVSAVVALFLYDKLILKSKA
ncbi:MFS transporter [Carboxylicivirga sp. RSCT41]|uniref:MFS transporter n=1 Tax=Carboxylicivirga agarovorans TaxID=3417570 RepID=UPI003D337102